MSGQTVALGDSQGNALNKACISQPAGVAPPIYSITSST